MVKFSTVIFTAVFVQAINSCCAANAVQNPQNVDVLLPQRMNLSSERLRWVDEKPRLHFDFSLSEKAMRGFSFSSRGVGEENYQSGIRPYVGVLGVYELISGISTRFGVEIGFLSRKGWLDGMGGKLEASQELYWASVPLGIEYVLMVSQRFLPFFAFDLRPGMVLEDRSVLGNTRNHFILSAEESLGFTIPAFAETRIGLRGFFGHSLVTEGDITWLGAGLSLCW